MSYGTDPLDRFRRAGVCWSDPQGAVAQSTKFEFVINLQNGQRARPRSTVDAHRPRRRGYRVTLGALLSNASAPRTNVSDARGIKDLPETSTPVTPSDFSRVARTAISDAY